jgi:uncharacterized protein|tara:strand:+ start:204 stop:479 length:276 start_codon:yes stop_codon:yes gene_type:complete
MNEEQQEAPKIEFPCEYPIKVVGRAAPDYKQFVTDVILRHAADLDLSTVQIQPSRNGNFYSVRFTIIATGVDQLEAIFEELKASGRVTMVI